MCSSDLPIPTCVKDARNEMTHGLGGSQPVSRGKEAYWFDKSIYMYMTIAYPIIVSEEDKIVDHFEDGHWVDLGPRAWELYCNWKAEQVLLNT
jgi:hypothetical protein